MRKFFVFQYGAVPTVSLFEKLSLKVRNTSLISQIQRSQIARHILALKALTNPLKEEESIPSALAQITVCSEEKRVPGRFSAHKLLEREREPILAIPALTNPLNVVQTERCKPLLQTLEKGGEETLCFCVAVEVTAKQTKDFLFDTRPFCRRWYRRCCRRLAGGAVRRNGSFFFHRQMDL